MEPDFQTFESFNDIEFANAIAGKLKQNNIEVVIEKSKHLLDKTFVDTSLEPDIHIKLRPDDFEKGHQILEEYYKTMLDSVEKDYYLFDFSNEELREIIAKPDEWGHFDYQLAQKLLKERGDEIDPAELNKLKQDRITQLSEPEKASRWILVCCYSFFLFGFLVTFFVGRHFYLNKRPLPNGQLIYTYRESDRRHGHMIMIISGALIILAVLSALIFWVLS